MTKVGCALSISKILKVYLMFNKKNSRRLVKFAFNPKFVFSKPKYLFILSHMRSRSSLLSHILGSNKEICGHSELHISYSSQLDLVKMKVKLCEEFKDKRINGYLLDKLLHNPLSLSTKILDVTESKILFLVRKPESTIKSIIKMGQLTGEPWHKDPEKVLEYYCSRLSYLNKYSIALKGNYFFIDSDDIVKDTKISLRGLSEWLDLDEPLSENYSIFRDTGKAGRGDRSRNLKTGKIIYSKSHSDVEISAEILKKGQIAFEECKWALLGNMISD